MESIIQKDKDHCFICGMNRNLEPLDCHHIYGAANRSKSENKVEDIDKANYYLNEFLKMEDEKHGKS